MCFIKPPRAHTTRRAELVVCGLLIALAITPARAQQVEREQFIARLVQAGVFQKLERPATLRHLWTGPRWAATSFDQKSSFVNVVYAYCVTQAPDQRIVILRDGQTGKRIGEYSEIGGGLKLK